MPGAVNLACSWVENWKENNMKIEMRTNSTKKNKQKKNDGNEFKSKKNIERYWCLQNDFPKKKAKT